VGNQGIDQAAHAAAQATYAAPELLGRDLKAEQGGRLARLQQLERAAFEAVRAGDRLLDQRVVAEPEITDEPRHELAARHEAFGAALDQEAVAALAPDLPAQAVGSLQHAHLRALREAHGHAQSSQPGTDDDDSHARSLEHGKEPASELCAEHSPHHERGAERLTR
jgi:hypothetical protein